MGPSIPESLGLICARLEVRLPRGTREILEEFELVEGHPWEPHLCSPVTTYYACLYGLAQAWRPRRVLELGTGFGLRTAALLLACDPLELLVSLDAGVFSREYDFPENYLEFARRKLHAWCRKKGVPLERVQLFQVNTQPLGKSDNYQGLAEVPHWTAHRELRELLAPGSFDLLFVDGKQPEDCLYQDLRHFWRFVRPGGLVVCDGLHDDSYQGLIPWAAATLASFRRFLGEFAAYIEEHHIWPFPRVRPEGPAGLRPFGLIRKKAARVPQVSDVGAPVPCPEVKATGLLQDLELLSRASRRLYFRDQTPASLAALVAMAEEHQPTRIVELGTCMGLSLRAWLAARTQAQVIAVDRSFTPLRDSLKIAPLELGRMTLLEQDILATDFSRLWGPGDRVLLYVDAHDLPQVSIMSYLIASALPYLPPGSLVAVDDLWFSPEILTPENVEEFFYSKVFPEIDPLQCLSGHYASYWQGGAFFGFAEVVPLLTWVNKQGLTLRLHPGAKVVSFFWPPAAPTAAEPRSTASGEFFYNPLASYALTGAGPLTWSKERLTALSRYLQGAECFSRGRIQEALAYFTEAGEVWPGLAGAAYARAVCLARLGNFPEALASLEQELAGPFPRREAGRLRGDLEKWLQDSESYPCRAKGAPRRAPLTLFTCPKAFEGHIGVIQRNALESWRLLSPRPEIILFGNDPGTAATALELGLRHVPEVALSERGTPLVGDLFRRAESLSSGLLAYVNADIILGQDFMDAILEVEKNFDRFLMVGQRWDLDQDGPLDFGDPKWAVALRERVAREACLHVESALDYFVFTRGLWPEIPEFALGRTAWDNWLVAQPLSRGLPVVDATQRVLAVHQNHQYGHVPGGKEEAWRGAEARRNQELAWESPFLCYSSHAPWELTDQGLKERPRVARAVALAWEGAALLKERRWAEALSRLADSLRLLPQGLPGLWFCQAQALAGLGRRTEAVRALEQELAAHPSHHPARRLLESLREKKALALVPSEKVALATSSPLVSVVIPTHNRARYVKEAVESALSQEFPNLEVVVVDDGSTDGTSEVLAEIADPRLRYLWKPKSNAPDTRNHGIKAARAPWILWLDSDDRLLPGWLARLGSLLEGGAEAEVFYGNLEVVDPEGRRLHILRYEDFTGKNHLLLARMVHGNPLPLPGSLVSKALLVEVGGFDREFTRAHDYELWTRLAPLARFRHVPFLAVTWRWHDGNMSSGTVVRDLTFEARILKRLLTRHSLKELFPDLPWEDWPRAQALAARQLADLFGRYGDRQAAREWLQEAQKVVPLASEIIEHASAP